MGLVGEFQPDLEPFRIVPVIHSDSVIGVPRYFYTAKTRSKLSPGVQRGGDDGVVSGRPRSVVARCLSFVFGITVYYLSSSPGGGGHAGFTHWITTAHPALSGSCCK